MDHVDKAEAMDSFFEDLLGTSADRPFSLDLDYLGFPSITLSEIDGEFTMKEVRNAIKGMPLDKFPSPDGFLAHFFVVCWDIVKEDVMAAFNSLSRLDSHGHGFKAVNSALITLLPKRSGAQEVKYFQPISLIHDVAKWVAKVIANRLAPSSHSWWDLTRVPLCADIAFFLEVLRKMVFGDRLLACICALLSMASTHVLLNGYSGSRLANRRGLSQGDPSPLSCSSWSWRFFTSC
jgi:hypothetical protein